MNEFCECPMAGYCKRHQMKKGQARFNLCKGVGKEKDCGLSYWRAWERGELGATAPNNPQLNPKGFCSEKQLPTPVLENISNIGNRLHEIILRETSVEIPCDECKERILLLNQMTKKQAIEKREETILDILNRAFKVAPKLWQKIGLVADNILKTGVAKSIISSWVDEAINLEPDMVQPIPVEIIVKKKKNRTVGRAVIR